MVSIQLPKAILFDMDNTILANDSTSPRSWERAFARFASRLGGLDVQEFVGAMNEIRPRMQGDPVWDQWARFNVAASRRELVALAFSRLGVNAGETADEVANAYAETREASLEVFHGAIGALKHIQEMGKGMALITNGLSSIQRGKINRFGLEPFFDCIVIEEELGVGKPDPRVFQHALDQLAVQPSDAMMVGDNLETDIAGAQSLGIYTVWVDWKGGGLPESSPTTPDSTVRSVAELLS